MQYFLYIWHDKVRQMFYIGVHEGEISDGYVSSSRWFNGEYQYRTKDFKRKILKIFNNRETARKEEARFLRMIKDSEFGKKYYNLKAGKPSGIEPWNKGKKDVYSNETIQKMSNAKKDKPSPTKGRKFPKQTGLGNNMNKLEAKQKLSKTVTGRKRKYHPDGSWTWYYPLIAN